MWFVLERERERAEGRGGGGGDTARHYCRHGRFNALRLSTDESIRCCFFFLFCCCLFFVCFCLFGVGLVVVTLLSQWEIRVAFAEESKLRQSHATQPSTNNELLAYGIMYAVLNSV